MDRILCKIGIHKPHVWSNHAKVITAKRNFYQNFDLLNYEICKRCGAIKSKTAFIPKVISQISQYYAAQPNNKEHICQ